MTKEISIEYEDLRDALQQLQSLKWKMVSIPNNLISNTYSYWENSRLNGVSSSMLDNAGDIDTNLLNYFDLCYRQGRYENDERC